MKQLIPASRHRTVVSCPNSPTPAAPRTLAPMLILMFGALLVTGITPAMAYEPQWVAPVGSTRSPQVVAAFDPPSQPWLAGHRGVDLAASRGTPVRAAGNGVVTYVGRLAGRGVVTVTHGELRTTYEPVDAAVGYGESVAAGQTIGTIGTGGHCDQRCLHWGLLRDEQYLDPLLLLTFESPVLKTPRRAESGRTTTTKATESAADTSSLATRRESTTQPADQPSSTHTRVVAQAERTDGGATLNAVALAGIVGGAISVAQWQRRRR